MNDIREDLTLQCPQRQVDKTMFFKPKETCVENPNTDVICSEIKVYIIFR